MGEGSFFPTYFKCWGAEELEAINRVIASDWFTYGQEVANFETEYAAYHRRKYAIAVNSGSSANLIAIAALFHLKKNPLKRGDRVLVPAIAWATTYAPLVQYGLELSLLDVTDTWNSEVSAKFDPEGVRLIIGCSILGSPATVDKWQSVATALGAYFVNDDCESLGAVINGGSTTGSFGLMATSSFFMSHQISAIEGGAILTDDEECYHLCRMLRSHGWTRDVKKAVDFSEEYRFEIFGFNCRPLEIHAAVARVQLKKLQQFIAARRSNMRNFRNLTRGLPIIHQNVRGMEPSPFGLAFCVSSKEIRSTLVAELRKNGIDCRLPTGGSFTKHPYGAPWRSQSTPNADRIHDTGLFLGNAPFPINEQIEKAASVLKEVLE